jgi:hypothetical protein
MPEAVDAEQRNDESACREILNEGGFFTELCWQDYKEQAYSECGER